MSTTYVIERKRNMPSRPITDDSGTLRFVIQSSGVLSKKLSVRDAGGIEVAVISRGGFSKQYELLADGQRVTVRPRGFIGRNIEISTVSGPLEVAGDYRARNGYSVTRGGMTAAAVRLGKQQFDVEVTDGESSVLMLGVALTIDQINADREARAAAG